MFYTIYKITNTINGRVYIGKHQTKDLNDGYMGSGKRLKSAINKHGIESFKKEILFQFDNEVDMNTKEVELVTEEFCLREDTYNICPGGEGGWGYVNQETWTKEKRIEHNTKCSPFGEVEFRKKYKQSILDGYSNGLGKMSYEDRILAWEKSGAHSMLGKFHTEETKEKMSNSHRGEKNSQFRSFWITNGIESKKVQGDSQVPSGWSRGRIMR